MIGFLLQFQSESRSFIGSLRDCPWASPVSAVFRPLAWMQSDQDACPVPVLNLFPKEALSRLPKDKSRGHVYPLSYLPYF